MAKDCVPLWRFWVVRNGIKLLIIVGGIGIAGMYIAAQHASFVGEVASILGMLAVMAVLAIVVTASENRINRRGTRA